MHKNSPLLSIVMPTRNRFDYVRYSIKSILSMPTQQIELVVSDNSNSNELELWLKDNVSDSRFVYHYSSVPVTMCENYETAMGLASGEYIGLIGDDDGISIEIVDAASWAKDCELDALVPAALVNYVWPDLRLKSKGSIKPGELQIRSFTGNKTIIDPSEEMIKCARAAGQKFYALPKAYYGIVRKQCMDHVKDRTGSYFP